MNGPAHYAKAQELLRAVTLDESGLPSTAHGLDRIIAAAQVHATLALTMATALPPQACVGETRVVAAWCDVERES